MFRCWFPVGSPEGEDALARNVAAAVPAALAFTGAVPVGVSAQAVEAAQAGLIPADGDGPEV